MMAANCRCMTPPFDYRDYDRRDIGIDDSNGRFGEVAIETCKSCGSRWLRYFVEYEHIPRSGRWYRGLISAQIAGVVTPANAVEVLRELPWRYAGGSHFDSTGFRSTGAIELD